MSDCVLAVVANKRYLNPAKSLFFGAYNTGQWEEDMAFVPFTDVTDEEATWFETRGISVQRFDAPTDTSQLTEAQAAQFHKLNLFRTNFKKWKRVVYLDCDILLLRNMQSLAALETSGKLMVDGEDWPTGLASQFSPTQAPALFEELEKEVVDISVPNFNTSSMIFDTELITDDTYASLVKLLHKYQPILKNGDQPVINLHFYDRWKQLPPDTLGFFQAPNAASSIGLHFCNWNAPWALDGTNIQSIWQENLASAEEASSLVRAARQ